MPRRPPEAPHMVNWRRALVMWCGRTLAALVNSTVLESLRNTEKPRVDAGWGEFECRFRGIRHPCQHASAWMQFFFAASGPRPSYWMPWVRPNLAYCWHVFFPHPLAIGFVLSVMATTSHLTMSMCCFSIAVQE